MAALLWLLRESVREEEQALVFAATKHHVEYLSELLTTAGFSAAGLYSSMDSTARNINVARFRKGELKVHPQQRRPTFGR